MPSQDRRRLIPPARSDRRTPGQRPRRRLVRAARVGNRAAGACSGRWSGPRDPQRVPDSRFFGLPDAGGGGAVRADPRLCLGGHIPPTGRRDDHPEPGSSRRYHGCGGDRRLSRDRPPLAASSDAHHHSHSPDGALGHGVPDMGGRPGRRMGEVELGLQDCDLLGVHPLHDPFASPDRGLHSDLRIFVGREFHTVRRQDADIGRRLRPQSRA